MVQNIQFIIIQDKQNKEHVFWIWKQWILVIFACKNVLKD